MPANEPTETERQLAGHIADARRSLTPDAAAVGQVHATLAVAYAILVAAENQSGPAYPSEAAH